MPRLNDKPTLQNETPAAGPSRTVQLLNRTSEARTRPLTAIGIAAAANSPEMLRLLEANGARLGAVLRSPPAAAGMPLHPGNAARSSLVYAVTAGAAEAVGTLLQLGADVRECDCFGESALHAAALQVRPHPCLSGPCTSMEV